jgi:hypothetical protein
MTKVHQKTMYNLRKKIPDEYFKAILHKNESRNAFLQRKINMLSRDVNNNNDICSVRMYNLKKIIVLTQIIVFLQTVFLLENTLSLWSSSFTYCSVEMPIFVTDTFSNFTSIFT